MSYRVAAAALAVGFFVAPAWGATVTELPGPPVGGMVLDLSVNDFVRIGACGGGGSVVNDGCSVIVKDNPLAEHAFGRFDPLGGDWIDSQDIDELLWVISSPAKFASVTFALTDAHDQDNSHFRMFYKDGGIWQQIWDIPAKLPNGNLFWLMVDFGKDVESAEFRFSTKVGAGYDGYGISQPTLPDIPAAVPLPPAAPLLLSAGLLMAGIRRRQSQRRKSAD